MRCSEWHYGMAPAMLSALRSDPDTSYLKLEDPGALKTHAALCSLNAAGRGGDRRDSFPKPHDRKLLGKESA